MGHSIDQFAEAVGVHRSTVIGWEKSVRGMHARTRPRVAEVLRVSLDELEFLLSIDVAAMAPEQVGTGGTLDLDSESEGGDVQRREFLALAGTTVAGVLVNPTAVLQDLAMSLIDTGARPNLSVDLRLGTLEHRVVAIKHAYQACLYEVVAEDLPRLLARLQAAETITVGDERQQIAALAAQAYHVAASVFLKLDGGDMAGVAAQRSVDAAERSDDPLVIGTSARILTHTLMHSGQYVEATNEAIRAAQRLVASVETESPESLSVVGALLLRGAIAASHAENGAECRALLDEAASAANRLPSGANLQWTAFGSDNVLAHRVAAEITLGNAGLAVDNLRQIDLEGLGIAERRATVLVDGARAYSQWGKYEQAVSALHAAGHVSSQELRVRAPVRNLVQHLRTAAPASVQRELNSLVERHGLAA